MDSANKKRSEEDSQSGRELEERRGVIEEYTADLRAVMDKLRRMLT